MNTDRNMLRHFAYRAVDRSGKIIKGTAVAHSVKGLYLYLSEQQLSLLHSCPTVPFPSLRKKISNTELIDFCLHMQYMDQAGVPVLDALRDAQTTIPNLATIIDDLIRHIKRGAMLSQALGNHEKIFPPLFRHIIELSERSGNLSDGFKKLYDHLSWSEKNKKELAKSIRYPFIVFLLICIVVWLMTTLVIPQMQDLMTASGVDVPLSSLWVIKISSTIGTCFPFITVVMVFLGIFLLFLRSTSHTQRLMQDRYILKIPQLGNFFHKRDICLYLHFLYVCFSAGIDLLDCLNYSNHGVKNAWLKQKLKLMEAKIREGEPLSQAFKNTGVFDASTIRMIQIGEITGQLKPLLATLETYQMRDLKARIDKCIAYLQPILLGTVGLMLIWIVLGIFYPMYDHLLILEDMS